MDLDSISVPEEAVSDGAVHMSIIFVSAPLADHVICGPFVFSEELNKLNFVFN